MNTKTILGISLATVFTFAMMTNPVFATSPALLIAGTSFDGSGCSITTGGNPGTAMKGHDIIVYVCTTDPLGTADNKVWLAAVHPSFNDDPEQANGNKVIHTHEGFLQADNCVKPGTLVDNTNGVASVNGNTINIPTDGTNIDTFAIVGYDIAADGSICPTAVYSAV